MITESPSALSEVPFYVEGVGYFPEFVSPDQPEQWKRINMPGGWFCYLIYSHRVENPLYVGCTGNIFARLSWHRRMKAWWPLADSIIVDLSDTREESLRDERARITKMQPLFNIVGNRHA